MKELLEKLVKEKDELDLRIEKLTDFLEKDNCGKLSEEEIELLIAQHDAMRVYSFILKQRISLVKKKV